MGITIARAILEDVEWKIFSPFAFSIPHSTSSFYFSKRKKVKNTMAPWSFMSWFGGNKAPCEAPQKFVVSDYFAGPSRYARGNNWVANGPGIPGQDIDISSFLRGSLPSRGIVPNRCPQSSSGIAPLPNVASKRERVVAAANSSALWPQYDVTPKACMPRDNHFYRRVFQIFDGMPVVPNACVNNVVQAGPEYRQGINSRYNCNIYSKDLGR